MTITGSTLITDTTAADEVQTIYFAGMPSNIPDEGSFKMYFGTELTDAIAYSEGAAEIQTALRALASLSEVTVSGTFATGFTVTFTGADGDQTQNALVIYANTLKMGDGPIKVVVEETTPGSAGDDVAVTVAEDTAGAPDASVATTVAVTQAGGTDNDDGVYVDASAAETWEVAVPITAAYAKSDDGATDCPIEVTEG